MKPTSAKSSFLKRAARYCKLQYLKLLRSPGGARKVAMGFSVGFALEFLVISTAGLVYLVYYPLIRLFRGSLPASVIGHLIAKLTLLPVILIPLAKIVGTFFHVPKIPLSHVGIKDVKALGILLNTAVKILNAQMEVLIGMLVFAPVLAALVYFPVHYAYEFNRKRREAKRRGKNEG